MKIVVRIKVRPYTKIKLKGVKNAEKKNYAKHELARGA